ncbi:hypothetical protein ACLOJK_009485 [Asimina triloba]
MATAQFAMGKVLEKRLGSGFPGDEDEMPWERMMKHVFSRFKEIVKQEMKRATEKSTLIVEELASTRGLSPDCTPTFGAGQVGPTIIASTDQVVPAVIVIDCDCHDHLDELGGLVIKKIGRQALAMPDHGRRSNKISASYECVSLPTTKNPLGLPLPILTSPSPIVVEDPLIDKRDMRSSLFIPVVHEDVAN